MELSVVVQPDPMMGLHMSSPSPSCNVTSGKAREGTEDFSVLPATFYRTLIISFKQLK
jgi:hypothetical protein